MYKWKLMNSKLVKLIVVTVIILISLTNLAPLQ